MSGCRTVEGRPLSSSEVNRQTKVIKVEDESRRVRKLELTDTVQYK
jgi:hypothetical protein